MLLYKFSMVPGCLDETVLLMSPRMRFTLCSFQYNDVMASNLQQ